MSAEPRFLTLPDVAEILNISLSQTRALVRRGELVGVQIGGRGQWRVERVELENYIARLYEQTRAFVAAAGPDDETPTDGDDDLGGALDSARDGKLSDAERRG